MSIAVKNIWTESRLHTEDKNTVNWLCVFDFDTSPNLFSWMYELELRIGGDSFAIFPWRDVDRIKLKINKRWTFLREMKKTNEIVLGQRF